MVPFHEISIQMLGLKIIFNGLDGMVVDFTAKYVIELCFNVSHRLNWCFHA